MLTARMKPAAERDDAELVSASLSGNRDAFGQIVARYQSLVCSLAYSATGSLSQSEDLGQETFLAAWKQLAGLREPEKLCAWLCGIARNLINNTLRRQGREPVCVAEPLESAPESPSLEASPPDQAISMEEEAILWRSIGRVPEIYREPLVLFYREHRSVEAVARHLGLSEDAVKQRLSRGRKLLEEQVRAFVEGALERTNPGKAFTLSVTAALPLLAVAGQSATAGATAAKGSTALKILFMTKTTQAIVVAAVTVTAVLTTQTVWHHFNPPDASGTSHLKQVSLATREATEAQQNTRNFLEAFGKGDWDTIARFWPENAPNGRRMNDIFTDDKKSYVAGGEIVKLGKPFKEAGNPAILIPYEFRFKDGNVQKNNLRMMKDSAGNWHWIGGF